MPVPSPVKNRDGTDSYSYGNIIDYRGRKQSVILPVGEHIFRERGVDTGYGLKHIIARKHDQELYEMSKYKDVKKAIFDMLQVWKQQGMQNGDSVIGGKDGDQFALEWIDNRPLKAPRLRLVLSENNRLTPDPFHYVHSFYPSETRVYERGPKPYRRFSAIPTQIMEEYDATARQQEGKLLSLYNPESIRRVEEGERTEDGRSRAREELAASAWRASFQPVTEQELRNIENASDEEFRMFFKRPGWAVLTATKESIDPRFKDEINNRNNQELRYLLERDGVPYAELSGVYKGEDQGVSFLILMDEDKALSLGRRYGQESILTNSGLVYSSPLPVTPATGEMLVDEEARAEDFFSEFVPRQDPEQAQRNYRRAFSMGLDFSRGPGRAVIPEGYYEISSRPQLPIRKEDGMVELYHWSGRSLSVVDPSFRLTGPFRIQAPVGYAASFYGINPRGSLRAQGTGYVKEYLLGSTPHMALVEPEKLYPFHLDPDNLKATVTGQTPEDHRQYYERAIINAGYIGYYTEVPADAPGLSPLGNVAVVAVPLPVEVVRKREFPTELLSRVPISRKLKKLSVLDRIDENGNFKDVAPRNKKGERVSNVKKEDAVLALQADRNNFVFDLRDPASEDQIATIMAAEAEAALNGDVRALGWYDRLVKMAKRVVSVLHPEILSDREAEHAFDFATAVASNGLSVKDNYILANKQYEHWKRTGYFIEGKDGTSGTQGEAMQGAFLAYNTMKRPMDSGGLGMSDPEIMEFLSSRMKIRDLKNNTTVRRLGIQIDAKEKADSVVNGSYIMGPKIGQGFYQNLRGNFDQLTMDRWWMRFFNRLSGNPFKTYADGTINKGINRLRDMMVNPSDVPMILQAMKDIDADILTDEIVGQLSVEIDKVFQRAYMKAPKWQKPVKTEVFIAANALRPKIEGELEESPRNATDRSFMRAVTRRAINKLARATNVRLDMADFQALMWYWEKKLWRSLGVRQGRGEDNDYVDGAIELLRRKGIPDEKIREALPDSERQRLDTQPDTARDDVEIPSGVGERLSAVPRAGRVAGGAATRGAGGRPGTREAEARALATPEQAVALSPLEPLPGAPRVEGFTGPDPSLVRIADKYAKSIGLDLRRQSEYVDVDPERATRIAAAYDAMPHAPQDPKVREAYQNLIRQTLAQYNALAQDGYQFWFTDPSRPDNEAYLSSPWNALRDIRANKQMGVFPTAGGFGSGATELNVEDNPMLEDTGLRWPVGSPDSEQTAPVLANDLFRAVHDAFGHGLEGSGFRARGEENAWQAHVRLFTGSAVGAITSETRGQNSWLNYGPYGDSNRNAKVEDTVFADQKTGLMPDWTWTEGRAGDMPVQEPTSAPSPTPLARQSMVPTRNSAAGKVQRQTAQKQTNVVYSKAADLLAKGLRITRIGADEARSKQIADGIIKKFQDGMIPVGRMIDELRANGLNITDAMDTYMQEELYHGVVGEKVEQAQTNLYRPLIDLVGTLKVTDQAKQQLIAASNSASVGRGFADVAFKDTRSNALSMADIFLYASHAKERNEYIRGIDPENDAGSGMTDKEADAILAWFARSPYASTMQKIADATQRIVQSTNDVRLEGGLIPREFFQYTDPTTGDTVDVPQYDNYVPLRGKRDPSGEPVDEQATGPYRSPMYGARRREDRRSLGRYDYADNIIPNLLVQNQNAIIRAERNKVGQSFLQLLRSDPAKTKAYGRILKPGDMKDVQKRVLVERKRADGTVVQTVQTMLDPNFRNEPDIFVVKEDGKEVIVKLESDAIASALKGSMSPTHNNGLIRVLATINRYLASINTSLNPSFFITNMFRDLQTAGVNVAQYEIDGLTRKIVRDVPGALRGIKQSIRNNDNSSEWARIYRDFVKNGGQNATNQVNTVADQMNNISGIIGDIADSGARKQFNRVKNGFVGKGAMSLLSFVEDYNTVIENGIRVTTYKALLDKGFTPQRAAQAARNITVNFAKGGDYKTFMNAMYLFYNASLQGSFAMLNAALRSKRVQKFWAAAIGVGIMQDYLNAMMSGDDEDGEKLYDKIPEYVLEHNLILPDVFGFTDRSYISIPMPYGLNMAHNLGRAMGRLSRGAYEPAEAANTIVGTMLDTINPIGGADNFADPNVVAPTVLDPFIDIWQNENFAGVPIYKEGFPGDRTPSSQLYWSTASVPSVWLANAMNSITGGSTEVKGLADVHPDLIDFWFEYLTGGVGRFVIRTAETPFKAYDEGFSEDVIRNVPIFGKIIGTITTREDTGAYVEKRNRVLTALDEVKAAVEEGNTERLAGARERFSDELKVSGAVRAIDNALRKLSRQMRQVREGRLPEDQKRLILERLDERRQQLTARANQLMRDI